MTKNNYSKSELGLKQRITMMDEAIQKILQDSIDVKKEAITANSDHIVTAVQEITKALLAGNKLFFFGNGGSAADSQHIAAEFIGRFQKERKSLPAIALTTDTSILTSLGNDYGFDRIFSRQIEGLAHPGDISVGISTSGNSKNVIAGIKKAKEIGLKTISLTGNDGGKLAKESDISIIVRSKVTARVQESHICIGHIICELVENHF